jgi:hypothetical protein
LARRDRNRSLNDGRIQNPSKAFGIVPLSNFAPRGFGFVHHSIALLYHQVPNRSLTIRHFCIAVSHSPTCFSLAPRWRPVTPRWLRPRRRRWWRRRNGYRWRRRRRRLPTWRRRWRRRWRLPGRRPWVLCRARCGSLRWSSCGRLTLTLTLTSVAPGAAAGGGAHARVVGAGVVEPRAGEVLPLPVSVTGELKYRGARMVRTQCPLYKRTLIVNYKI